jgi:hypothetical protein
MTNNPRNPLPGEQPESPQDPSQSMDPSQQQTPGQQMPGQPAPGQPGQRVSGQQQSDPGPATPASGTTRSTGSSATGATPVTAPHERTTSEPRVQQTTSQPVQRSGGTTRTYEQPRRSNNNKKIALVGILGLAAVAGIITGFAASNNSSAPVAAVRRAPVARAPHAPVSSSFKVLTTFNESGTRTSAPFAVTNPSAAHWSYRCAHGAHAFSASMATTSGGNRLPIASTSGTSGTGTAILRPSSTGSKYQISANSACPYHIRVYGT